MSDAPQVVPLHQPPGRRVRRPRREPLWRHVIGDVLRQERRRQGRTLRELSEDAQVSMAYLSEVERGRKEVSSELLAATARALGLTLADLVARTHELLAAEQAAAQEPLVLRTVTTRHTGTAGGTAHDRGPVSLAA